MAVNIPSGAAGGASAMERGNTSMRAGAAFSFGPFRLIPDQRVLLRGNQVLKLGSRAFDILHFLLRRAAEDVSKEALIRFAWPDVFVHDSNLKVHISSIRRTLDDTSPQAAYIATIPGRGYRFVGQVERESPAPAGFALQARPDLGNLPPPVSLVARRQEVASAGRALHGHSTVTLAGPGGVGKTSLAIAAAHAERDNFPDGVLFLDLSGVDDPALVPHLLATSLGVRCAPGDLPAALLAHLQAKRILVVLDNCEHVLHAAASVAAMFEGLEASRLLATSREPLGLRSEHVQRMEPLRFPERADRLSAAEVLSYPAVELFALRALELADYQLAPEDAGTAAELCAALDGLPLALEIAAGQLDRFTPAELLASITRRFSEVSRQASVGAAPRRTLRAALDWSYRLLPPEQAELFRLLSTFAGSFEWSDAAGMSQLAGYSPYQITTALGGLVAKSLIGAEISGDQLCYRYLSITRCFAGELLAADRHASAAHRKHAEIVLATVRKAEQEWARVGDQLWRARYEAKMPELRKALDWSFSSGGDPCLGIDIALYAIRLWNELSAVSEQLFQVERALACSPPHAAAAEQAAALATARAWSMTLARQLDARTDEAWAAARRFSELSEGAGPRLAALCGQAVFLIYTGRSGEASALLDSMIRTAGGLRDPASVFDGERLRTLADMHLGKLDEVRLKLEQMAAQLAGGAPPSRVTRYRLQRYVSIHTTLAFSTWLAGWPGRALAMVEEMLRETGEAGQLMGQANVLALVALPLALWSGDAGSLQRHSAALGSILAQENIAIWEPVHSFYASASRAAQEGPRVINGMRSAIDQMIRDRLLVRVPMYLAALAQALCREQKFSEAQEAAESAKLWARQTGERWCLPEVLRVSAQALLGLGQKEEAQRALLAAWEEARQMGARSLELRCLYDLAQLRARDGRAGADLEQLALVYRGFQGEGGATEDLRDSARLLAAAGLL